MSKHNYSWCVLAVAAGCTTLTMSAQQIQLRDLTRPELTREIAPENYWTAERMAAAIPRTAPVVAAGTNATGETATTGPVKMAPGGRPELDPMAGSLADLAFPEAGGDSGKLSPRAQAEGMDGGTIQPQEAGVFASYPYPFTRFTTTPSLYNGAAVNPYPAYPYSTVGKLFFTIGGSNYVCSASVIRPHLVLTARHCILDATRGWATNVVFYPGYFGAPNPRLRGWRARRLATWGFGGNGALYKWDIGFIQTFDDDNRGCNRSAGGRPVESYTGYLGYLYGGNVADRNYTSLGYPQAAPFTGNIMIQAHSDVGAQNPFNQVQTFSMGNDMTGGSSGGPWIVGFGTTNWANGVNSYKWVNPARPLEMNSPNFQTDNFFNLLAYANGLACP